MNKKYFTPSIEDIRVGYEFELIDYASNNYGQDTSNCTWTKHIIKEEDLLSFYKEDSGIETYLSYLRKGHFRVPYLTKEQIEGEGWIFKEKAGARETYYIEMERGFRLYLSRWDEAYHGDVGIYGFDDQGSLFHWYSGDCKDINTLRYIMKLLKIKNEKFETAVRS